MSDGAHAGISADRALDTILGGAPAPTEDEGQTAEEMRAEIMALTEDPHTYGGTANWTAKLILEWLLADPRRAQFPIENVYEHDDAGNLVFNAEGGLNLIEHGWYDRMKDDGIDLADLGLSGFMWGWAVNAARRCLELPPVANPAIINI